MGAHAMHSNNDFLADAIIIVFHHHCLLLLPSSYSALQFFDCFCTKSAVNDVGFLPSFSFLQYHFGAVIAIDFKELKSPEKISNIGTYYTRTLSTFGNSLSNYWIFIDLFVWVNNVEI